MQVRPGCGVPRATLEISKATSQRPWPSSEPDGPAARSGLAVGDVIVSVDGHDVRGDQMLYWALSSVSPGNDRDLGARARIQRPHHRRRAAALSRHVSRPVKPQGRGGSRAGRPRHRRSRATGSGSRATPPRSARRRASRARDVQVAVDDGARAVAEVPVLGAPGAAPQRELRDGGRTAWSRRSGKWLTSTVGSCRSSAASRRLGLVARARRTRPRGSGAGRGGAGPRRCTPTPALARPVQRGAPRSHVVGAERVVVEQEQRRHHVRGPPAPAQTGYGSSGVSTPRSRQSRDQVSVAGLAAQLERVVGRGPQLVVARHPQHPGEALDERAQRAQEMLLALAERRPRR